MPPTLRPVVWLKRLLGSLGLMIGVSAVAATDPVIARGSSVLTDLTYELIDLDPADGIDPGITFGQLPYAFLLVRTMTEENRLVQYVPGGLSATGTHVVADPLGRAQASRDEQGMQAEVTVRVSDAQDLKEDPWGHKTRNWRSSVTLEGSPYNAWQFTLTPNTAVKLKGRSKADLEMDLQPLVDSGLLQSPGTGRQVNVWGWLDTMLLEQSESYLEIYGDVVDMDIRGSGIQGVATRDGWALVTDPVSMDVAWTLDYANTRAQPKQLAWNLGVNMSAGVTSVPEPEAIGLALSGLVMLAFVWRRQGGVARA